MQWNLAQLVYAYGDGANKLVLLALYYILLQENKTRSYTTWHLIHLTHTAQKYF
jgi:hypothetical protein